MLNSTRFRIPMRVEVRVRPMSSVKKSVALLTAGNGQWALKITAIKKN